ncbi:MAG: exo-alpha-sialidase [Puniceicoccaceae bacterium]
MKTLDNTLEQKLSALAKRLVDSSKARVIVKAQKDASGYWYGGGNMITGSDGNLYLTGRYRNYGDSRTGVGAGERGLELAIFSSPDKGQSWEKVVSFSKQDLDVGDRSVVSVEGSALNWTEDGVELFVSTEKSNLPYPEGYESFLKPGSGVWTIDVLKAESIEELKNAKIKTVLETDDLRYLHIKDPFIYKGKAGETVLLFCTHPFSWSSSNTGYTLRPKGADSFSNTNFDFFPRGTTWDVAITRGTAVVDVPKVGAFKDIRASLVFYDGGESLRNLDEHKTAVKRPRGYSCEELGGAGYFVDGNLNQIQRLSRIAPFFVSDTGTGCIRYVDVLDTPDGMYVTWQQSQEDLSQPLMLNFLSRAEIEQILQ